MSVTAGACRGGAYYRAGGAPTPTLHPLEGRRRVEQNTHSRMFEVLPSLVTPHPATCSFSKGVSGVVAAGSWMNEALDDTGVASLMTPTSYSGPV